MKLAIFLKLFDNKLVLLLILLIFLPIVLSLHLLNHTIGAIGDIINEPLRSREDVSQFLISYWEKNGVDVVYGMLEVVEYVCEAQAEDK